MSDLADLAADLTKDLPLAARKVIDAAIEHGWTLGKPGMTVALRLNHPDDELAQPVYIAWTVGRTAKGSMSFRFVSCSTRGLHPLSGADLLEYLADPTVVYDVPEIDSKDMKEAPPWDHTASAETNLTAQLGTVQKELEKPARIPLSPSPALRRQQAAETARAAGPPLRVTAPKA